VPALPSLLGTRSIVLSAAVQHDSDSAQRAGGNLRQLLAVRSMLGLDGLPANGRHLVRDRNHRGSRRPDPIIRSDGYSSLPGTVGLSRNAENARAFELPKPTRGLEPRTPSLRDMLEALPQRMVEPNQLATVDSVCLACAIPHPVRLGARLARRAATFAWWGFRRTWGVCAVSRAAQECSGTDG
jgi:hypothetical protein